MTSSGLMTHDPVLVVAERVRLAELESVVERGLVTFVEVGRALQEIRDSHLYRASHATFEKYCQERWKFTARRGRQLIAAAAIAGEMGTRVPIPTERHARELAPLVEAQGAAAAARVWDRLSENGEPTVATVHGAVANECGKRSDGAAPPSEAGPAISVSVKQWEALRTQLAKLQKACATFAAARAVVRAHQALPPAERRSAVRPLYYERVAKKVPVPVLDAVANLVAAADAIEARSMSVDAPIAASRERIARAGERP